MPESDLITDLLQRWQTGDVQAQEELFQLVYRELRRIAGLRLRNELPGHTLQATELVHEIYPQLARQRALWQNRSHFYALASECMRRYLVDHARTRSRQKRGGNAFKVSLSDLKPSEICRIEMSDEVLAVDRALEKLTEIDETAAVIIKHRYFGGLSREEIAEVLDVSPSTVDRTYRFAKAWLKRELTFEFSPYLLNVGQIKNNFDFIRQLQNNSGNEFAGQWRGIFPFEIQREIDSANPERETPALLVKIVTEINKLLFGGLSQPQTKNVDLAGEQTKFLSPEVQLKQNRRLLEDGFAGLIMKIT